MDVVCTSRALHTTLELSNAYLLDRDIIRDILVQGQALSPSLSRYVYGSQGSGDRRYTPPSTSVLGKQVDNQDGVASCHISHISIFPSGADYLL